jgi:hypothetical protein
MEMTIILLGGSLAIGVIFTAWALIADWRERH